MKIKPNATWNVNIEVGDWVIPTLAPTVVPEADAVHAPRRPGVLVRAWRWLVGEPDRRKVETEQVRGLCRLFVPAAFWETLDRLNGGQLALLYSAYMGAQAAWCGRAKQDAEAEMERQMGRATPERSETIEQRLGVAGKWKVAGLTPLRAGGPIPAGMAAMRGGKQA
ncbi:MAG: hypothetical protein KJZ65_06730 [Phycisphaerales bacterium]|nr:hypothetical protein [Phycisphaerales bacterium]